MASSIFSNISSKKHLKNILLLVFITALNIIIFYISTSRYGIGGSYDSANYLSIARNLITNGELKNFEGVFWAVQPPLYPILLALLSQILHMDVISSAFLINLVCVALLPLLAICIIYVYIKVSNFNIFVYLLPIIFSTSILEITSMAWTEALFLIIILLHFICIEYFIKTKKIVYFAILIVICSLAPLLRLIGVVLIISSLLRVLFSHIRPKIKLFSICLLLGALTPILTWAYITYNVTHFIFGPPLRGSYTVIDTFNTFLHTFASWFMPLFFYRAYFLIPLLVLSIIFIINIRIRHLLYQAINSCSYFLLYAIVYIVALFIFKPSIEPVSNRFLSPIYIPIIYYILYSLSLFATPSLRIYRASAFVLLGFWFFYLGTSSLADINYRRTTGAGGYNTVGLRDSQIVSYLLENERIFKDAKLYSNEPQALFFLAEWQSISAHVLNSNDNIEELAKDHLSRHFLILFEKQTVWFDDTLINISEILSSKHISIYQRFPDGSVYEIR